MVVLNCGNTLNLASTFRQSHGDSLAQPTRSVRARLRSRQCRNVPHHLDQLARVFFVEEAVELDMLRAQMRRHKCGDTIPISYIFFVRNPGPIRN
jgi:hypothetical protein